MIGDPEPAQIMSLPNVQVMVNRRCYLPCGCCVWIGIRMDNHESATVATPCRENHVRIMARFNDLFRWSLADGGTDRPLVDVVDEILSEASSEIVI